MEPALATVLEPVRLTVLVHALAVVLAFAVAVAKVHASIRAVHLVLIVATNVWFVLLHGVFLLAYFI